MPEQIQFRHINTFFQKKAADKAISALAHKFRLLTQGPSNTRAVHHHIGQIVRIYEKAILSLEQHISKAGIKASLTKLHKDIFVELEGLLSLKKDSERHTFLIVIPVADRPIMLKNCLRSLLRQCADFQYGGQTNIGPAGNQVYSRIAVLVIDDSKDGTNVKANKAIARDTTKAGLSTHYLGLAEQSGVLNQIPEKLRKNLKHIIGDYNNGVLPHKGASITRNIAYLLITEQLKNYPEKTLIYFIDSDEEFAVEVEQKSGYASRGTVNYFYWLDKLFSSNDIDILTGKVVGDPPVSPAVMINTFLEDVLPFFQQISKLNAHDPCIFHRKPSSRHSPAHYNDLVKMFGYKSSARSCPYPCPIEGQHTINDAFEEFSKKINGFFFGLHPTRKAMYYPDGGPLNISAARTVYTGNFVLKPGALRYFIPYADLKLRMAGPALGRLLQARIGKKFVSANLPLLHRRTLTRNHQGEFRPGLNNQERRVDLSEESIRQFWGDVLLFSVDELTKHGYPDVHLKSDFLAAVVEKTKQKIWYLYAENSKAVSEKIALLKEFLTNPDYWWNGCAGRVETVNRYKLFCSNLGFNFGIQSNGYQKLKNTFTSTNFSSQIVKALYDFYEDERLWNEVCGRHEPGHEDAKSLISVSEVH